MRIGFAGTPAVAVPALNALLTSHHQVVTVITRPDAQAGRGKKLTGSPVAEVAAHHGLEVMKPHQPGDESFLQRLLELNLDAIAVVAYGALLPQPALELVPWINLHFSLLPRWRGAAPVQRAIWAGDERTGATTFRIVRALDAGPCYRSLSIDIDQVSTAGEMLEALAHLGAPLLVDTMDDLADGVKPIDQGTEGITTAAKITVDDAHLAFDRPVEQVWRHLRAVTPSPGAWALLENAASGIERLKLLQARPAKDHQLAPGQLLATKRKLLVGTASSALELVQVQAAGKKPMVGADWARGVGAGGRLV